MRFPVFLAILGVCLPSVLGQTLPLQSSSRWILDADSARVKFRCANWVGHLETNLPEGLNKQSIDTIASWVAAQGFNCVCLTYSIGHALNQTVQVSDSFAAGAIASRNSVDSFADIYDAAVKLNPFLANATTGDVFGAVIDALWARGMMTVLDNHVSKAPWCCNYTDGNGWWDTASGYDADNSRWFVTQNWLDGLEAMASWALNHPGLVSMSLHNEVRQLPVINNVLDWLKYVEQGGTLIHSTKPNVLVVVGGVYGAMNLSQVKIMTLDTSGWAGKHVWEFHAYSFSLLFPRISEWCWTGPLWLSEFGLGMIGGNGDDGFASSDLTYLKCLVD